MAGIVTKPQIHEHSLSDCKTLAVSTAAGGRYSLYLLLLPESIKRPFNV